MQKLNFLSHKNFLSQKKTCLKMHFKSNSKENEFYDENCAKQSIFQNFVILIKFYGKHVFLFFIFIIQNLLKIN